MFNTTFLDKLSDNQNVNYCNKLLSTFGDYEIALIPYIKNTPEQKKAAIALVRIETKQVDVFDREREDEGKHYLID